MIRTISMFILCLVCTYCTNSINQHSDVPDIKGKRLRGDSITLKAIANNKLTLVNVWGIFCGPCIKELPLLHQVYNKYRNNDNFEFISIAMDSEQEFMQFLNPVDTTNHYKKMFLHSKVDSFYLPTLACLPNGYTYKYGGYAIIQDSTECRSIQKQIGSNAIPTTLIYNKVGRLVFKQIGSFDNEQVLMGKIDSLLSLQL